HLQNILDADIFVARALERRYVGDSGILDALDLALGHRNAYQRRDHALGNRQRHPATIRRTGQSIVLVTDLSALDDQQRRGIRFFQQRLCRQLLALVGVMLGQLDSLALWPSDRLAGSVNLLAGQQFFGAIEIGVLFLAAEQRAEELLGIGGFVQRLGVYSGSDAEQQRQGKQLCS